MASASHGAMLFNSYDFLFAFLPLTLAVYQVASRRGGMRAAWTWLTLASLGFYAYWYPPYLGLLLGSIAFNFVVGRVVGDEERSASTRRSVLTFGVVANLGLLGFYKYAGFLAANLSALTGWDLPIPAYALPIGISFFTFQQIAYIVDARQGRGAETSPRDYTLFVAFFPQLIAGPIIHHAEVMPQIREGKRATAEDRAVGLTMLGLGLAKKVLFADAMSLHADRIFGAVAAGHVPTVADAWVGLLAFFFQVYFDFSGYSDMAIGLARLFAIKLPVNFDAPYRASSMIDFWSRWHLTLSRFLRDYLYIPLGGSRQGQVRRWFNLFLTMTLGGLWHGAAWTFVLWGAANGIFLFINHAWRAVFGEARGRYARLWTRPLTLAAIFYGHVYFRAADVDDAWTVHRAMVGWTEAGWGSIAPDLAWQLLGLFAFTQLVPTSHRWMERYEPVLGRTVDTLRWSERFAWAPTRRWAIALGIVGLLCLPVLERARPFVYWAF